MTLLHLATKHELDGTHSICVAIDGREYEYTLRTERDVSIFLKLYKKCPGKALAFLKENDIAITRMKGRVCR